MKFKKAGIFTRIILIVLLVYAIFTLFTLRTRITAEKELQQSLRDKIEQQTASNAETDYAIRNSNDPKVIENVARAVLDMIYPKEKVYHID